MEVPTSGKSIDLLLERVLRMNILSSDYFKELSRFKTYHEVVDEIYNQVDHVEPWMTGNCRGPSTSFCLLYKFFTMKLTVNQMHGLLKHPDSPYIRAIGFLFLRYAGDPKQLWTWFEPYLQDDEEFSPGSSGRMTTMGMYIRDLLLGQYYFDTLLPRIPVPVLRQITANLEKMNLPTKHAGTTGEATRGGGVARLLAVRLRSKLPSQSRSVSVPLIGHRLGTPPLFAEQWHPLLLIEMAKMITPEDPPVNAVARVAIYQIGTTTGTVTGHVTEKGIGIWIEKETDIEKGTGTEISGVIMTDLDTEVGGNMLGVVGTVVVLVEAEAEAGAGVEVEVSRLMGPTLIIVQVLILKAEEIGTLHQAI